MIIVLFKEVWWGMRVAFEEGYMKGFGIRCVDFIGEYDENGGGLAFGKCVR